MLARARQAAGRVSRLGDACQCRRRLSTSRIWERKVSFNSALRKRRRELLCAHLPEAFVVRSERVWWKAVPLLRPIVLEANTYPVDPSQRQ